MNSERLRELIDLLLDANRTAKMQPKADKLEESLNNLSNQPNEPGFQNEVVSALSALNSALAEFIDGMSPATRESIASIYAMPYFSREFVDDVRLGLASNAMTPSVVRDQFSERNQQRRQFIDSLQRLVSSFEVIGIQRHVPQPGDAELGILIPRDLFRSELDPLSKELHQIHRIIAAFSEAAIGKVEQAEVREISTSDPVFFLGLNVAIVAMMAGSITWLLDTWERALKIKNLKEEARGAAFEEEELTLFDDKVEKLLTKLVRERVDQILAVAKVDANRRQELDTSLVWAHRALLARIERGMILEPRALPPAIEAGDGAEGADQDVAEVEIPEEYRTIEEIAPRLEYPVPSGRPILAITSEPTRPTRRSSSTTSSN